MEDFLSRTTLLFGEEAVEKFKKSHIAVFGIGGVGGHLAEALARSGVGALTLVDNDIICPSNLNRQIFALRSTLGMQKTEAAKARLLDINPEIKITTVNIFFLPENSHEIDFSDFTYAADCIDTVSGKLEIIERAKREGIPVISSMGAGNKLCPEKFEVADIYKTSVCPLAKVMRRELKKRGVKDLKVVCSKEPPLKPLKPQTAETQEDPSANKKRQTPGSSAFTPSAAGLIMAAEILKDIAKK